MGMRLAAEVLAIRARTTSMSGCGWLAHQRHGAPGATTQQTQQRERMHSESLRLVQPSVMQSRMVGRERGLAAYAPDGAGQDGVRRVFVPRMISFLIMVMMMMLCARAAGRRRRIGCVLFF